MCTSVQQDRASKLHRQQELVWPLSRTRPLPPLVICACVLSLGQHLAPFCQHAPRLSMLPRCLLMSASSSPALATFPRCTFLLHAGAGASKEQGPPGCCLFVYHIPVTWGDAELEQVRVSPTSLFFPPMMNDSCPRPARALEHPDRGCEGIQVQDDSTEAWDARDEVADEIGEFATGAGAGAGGILLPN